VEVNKIAKLNQLSTFIYELACNSNIFRGWTLIANLMNISEYRERAEKLM
jgi:hypothetical protein